MLKTQLARLKLAYLMRDWEGIGEVLNWLEQEGYLGAAVQAIPPLDRKELKQRFERTKEGGHMWLAGLQMAFKKKDWDAIGKVVEWLEIKGYIQ